VTDNLNSDGPLAEGADETTERLAAIESPLKSKGRLTSSVSKAIMIYIPD
jgi:hypothetical protein